MEKRESGKADIYSQMGRRRKNVKRDGPCGHHVVVGLDMVPASTDRMVQVTSNWTAGSLGGGGRSSRADYSVYRLYYFQISRSYE
jgi:hypothetical protein